MYLNELIQSDLIIGHVKLTVIIFYPVLFHSLNIVQNGVQYFVNWDLKKNVQANLFFLKTIYYRV